MGHTACLDILKNTFSCQYQNSSLRQFSLYSHCYIDYTILILKTIYRYIYVYSFENQDSVVNIAVRVQAELSEAVHIYMHTFLHTAKFL